MTTGKPLDYGDRVSTPDGDGTIVGFERKIGRVFVAIPGIAGAVAVKTADVIKETCDHEEVEMVGTSPSNLRFSCEVCGVEMMGDGPDAEGRETYCEAPRFD